MKTIFTRTLSVLLILVMVLGVVTPAMAATYRPGAQSGPSSSYAGSRYYENYKRVPITGDGRTDLVAIALSQLGYQEGNANGAFSGEVSGRYNYVEFSYNMGDLGLGYGGSDYPWCASFVSWCLYQSHNTDQNSWKDLGRYHVGDYNYIWKEISCSQWVRQLKGAGYYKYSKYEGGSYTPKYGDLVFFQNSGGVAHIGICLYVSGGRIYTVEGNTSDAAGLEPNGGGVYFKNYSLSTSYINGYGVLPYKTNSSVAKIDYSGNNPTPGLYVANAGKYIYATETATSYSWVMSRFTMFEVTQVCSNGRLKVIAKDSNGVTRTGYVMNNSDRVIQLSSTATNAADTARANLQKVITQAEQIWFYDYSEAQIYTIRSVYNTACTLVGDPNATAEDLTAAAASLRNEMAKTGSNTIAQNNQGIYVNGKNSVIQAGDCFLYSPGWNNGLITVDNANIRYTLNVVFTWDATRQINVVKSISYGSGNSTPSIQLGESEWMIACHDWETGIAAGDNPVYYSGTNYKVLSQLSVGDGVKLSGCTALTHNTYVEPGAFLKFIPADATVVHGENVPVQSGKTVLFTPSFNSGVLTAANANIGSTLNILIRWEDSQSAWVVDNKFQGTNGADHIAIVDGQLLLSAHEGDSADVGYPSSSYNWKMLNSAEIGQKVIFSGVSPTDGSTALSIAANISFGDYVIEDEEPEEEVIPSVNLALNKDYTAKDPGDRPHIANLTDGTYATALDFTGGWFGFACAGSAMNTNEEGVGIVVIDLGSTYALDKFRAHLYAGSEGASASVKPPLSMDVFLSNNGVDYVNVGQWLLSDEAAYPTSSFWAEIVNPGYAARYVKFEIAPSGDSTWVFVNELEVYGKDLTGGENVALTTGQEGTPVTGYEGNLTNGLTGDWYGINTATGSGSVIIDLGSRFKVNKVLAFVAAGSSITVPSKISVAVSPDGVNYFKTGELGLDASATTGYWAELTQDPTVGRYVKLTAESQQALVLISEVAVAGTVYTQSDNTNIAMGKTTVFTGYTDSPFTALLNDGLASDVFQYNVNNSAWFAFRNTGDATTGNVNLDNHRGLVTIDLGGQAEITAVRVHLLGGENDLGAVQPDHINVYFSDDGSFFDYMGYCILDRDATGAYWAVLDRSAVPVNARYVKLGIGVNSGTTVLLNEIEINGLMLTQDEANEPGSLSSAALVGSFNSWNTTPNMIILDESLVCGTLQLTKGTHEFKVLYNNEWYGNNGTIYNTTGGVGWVMDPSANNCTLEASQDGKYEFLFNLDTKELKVVYLPETMYLRGSFNDWGTEDVMVYNGDGTYSFTKTLDAGNHEYKIADLDYQYAWPEFNATLELTNRVDVTFTLNIYTGEVTATVVSLNHSYEAVVTAPTCTAAGYTTYTCTICGDSYVDEEVAALGHASYTYSYDSTNQIHSFTCTVCGETVTKTATDGKKFAINSAAPILSDDIIMKYSTTVPAGFEGAYMVFSFNGEDTTVSEYAVNASNGRYEFSFPGLNPQKMGDNICATLYAYVDGVEVSVQIASYSVVKYCDNQLKKTTITAELRTALSDLLIYGECNQIYEGYKTDVLVTSLLSANSTLTPSTFPAEGLDASYNLQKLSGTSLADCTFSSVTMTLGAKVVVRLTVTCTDTSKYTFKATLNGVDYNFTGDDLVPTGAENKYYLNFDQIKANLMGDVITFTIWEGDTQVSRTLEYSVYTYVQKNQTTTNEALANLLKALYNYGEAVKKV